MNARRELSGSSAQKIEIVAGVSIARCVAASRQSISRRTQSTFDRVRGESEASGESFGSSAQKSKLLRASVSLAASWHLVRPFLEGCKVRSTGFAANRKLGENSPAPALKNLNCCERQCRSLRRGISSDYFSRGAKYVRQGSRRIES